MKSEIIKSFLESWNIELKRKENTCLSLWNKTLNSVSGNYDTFKYENRLNKYVQFENDY